MELGISTATFFGKYLTEESFEQILKLDAHVTEVFLTTFSEYTKKFADTLKALLIDKPLKIHSIHSLNNQYEPELFNRMPRTRADAEKIFKDVLNVGQEIGAKCYTFHGPAKLKRIEYVFDYEYLGNRAEVLCKIAKEYNIEICYENVHWTFYSDNGYFENLKKYSPSLRACLDIKQAMQSKIDYKLFIEEMGENLKTVHVCDYDKSGSLCAPGFGIFEFKELIKILKHNGFSGPLILELYCEDYKNFEELKKGYNYLRDLLI